MARESRLLYLPRPTGGDTVEPGEVLSVSLEGIPMGWVFLFGGRNYWEPDEQVGERGGAASERQRFETPLEVADARLLNAMSSLRDSPHLWVWFASMEILRRRLKSKAKAGFLQLDAAWAFETPEIAAKTSQTPAYAENYVNMVNINRIENIPQYVSPLERICPFVPYCHPDDRKRARMAAKKLGDMSEAAAAAALLIGLPGDNPALFLERVTAFYEAEFRKIESLPPYPAVKARLSLSSDTVRRPDIPPADGGLLSRLKRLVGR
jgi:hypothetical protein